MYKKIFLLIVLGTILGHSTAMADGSDKEKTAVASTSLPGAPDGEYIVIEFSTAFENKASGVETVTPKMDKDGIWRVSGYYIK